jgi:hypothetical protein
MMRAEREAARVRDIIRDASNKLLAIEERL